MTLFPELEVLTDLRFFLVSTAIFRKFSYKQNHVTPFFSLSIALKTFHSKQLISQIFSGDLENWLKSEFQNLLRWFCSPLDVEYGYIYFYPKGNCLQDLELSENKKGQNFRVFRRGVGEGEGFARKVLGF